jgi:ribonuclease HII
MPKTTPTLDVETALWCSGFDLVAGIDEVGRGAWAGPMTIGAAVTAFSRGPFPEGLADSKDLTAKRRAAILPKVQDWVVDYAVGEVSPSEIDEFGVIRALRLAGRRALTNLSVAPDVVILDGDTDYLSGPAVRELAGLGECPMVRTEIKGDARCASVSAASVIAKEHRDAFMATLDDEFPAYAFGSNAGYGGAKKHMDAVRENGLTPWHRRSWNIPKAARPARPAA